MISTISTAAAARTFFGSLAITAAISALPDVLREDRPFAVFLCLACCLFLAAAAFACAPEAPERFLTFVAAFSLSMMIYFPLYFSVLS